MTIGAAIDNLMFNYGSMAELDRESLKQLIRSGQEQGFTVRQCYNGIRLCLGLEYQQQEVFPPEKQRKCLKYQKANY